MPLSSPRRHTAPDRVALTFDDGPDPVWTPRVLDALGHERLRATFFCCVGSALENPGLIERMAAEGHEVALHCVEHVRHSELSETEVLEEARAGRAALEGLGIEPASWRTPWGIETPASATAAEEFGLELWHWSFDTHDWRGDSAEEMAAALPGGELADGEVVLMHDGIGPGARRDGCEQTVELIGRLAALASRRRLEPTTLAEGTP
ncbi:polysaccharide deacetylase family protein [Thermoleophilia bacterium SCSIO 60948]|nr:polysaccharide deacetylase family protein [Thermoleophilia bacterium SCSIO 60948]